MLALTKTITRVMIGVMEHLERAIEIAGGVGRLASAIGLGQSAVSNWRARGVPPDPVHCAAIERATNGEVPVELLRPETQWHRIPDAKWPHPKGRPLIDVAAKEHAHVA